MGEQTSPYAIEPEPDYASRLEHVLTARLAVEHTQREDPDVMLDLATPRQNTRRPRRRLALPAIAACLAGLAIAGIVVRRVDHTHTNAAAQPLSVSFNLTWPELQGLEQERCVETDARFDSAVNQRCFRTFDGAATVTGDLDGTALWTMVGNLGKAANADDTSVEIPATFNGTYIVQATIPGCGTGEFMIAEQLRFDGWGSGAFSGSWQIVPASGRGELVNVGGGGVVPGDRPDQNTTQDLRTGHITC